MEQHCCQQKNNAGGGDGGGSKGGGSSSNATSPRKTGGAAGATTCRGGTVAAAWGGGGGSGDGRTNTAPLPPPPPRGKNNNSLPHVPPLPPGHSPLPRERVKAFMATCLLVSGILLSLRVTTTSPSSSSPSSLSAAAGGGHHVYLYQGDVSAVLSQKVVTLLDGGGDGDGSNDSTITQGGGEERKSNKSSGSSNNKKKQQQKKKHSTTTTTPSTVKRKEKEEEEEPVLQRMDIPPYQCNERDIAVDMVRDPGPNSYAEMEIRKACAFPLRPEEVVVGIWTSKATEAKVAPILATWGGKVPLELLGAVASDKYDVLLTGEGEDNYFSTLGKGFRGLKMMLESEKHRDKKWFVIMGDDVFLHIDNLVDALSAFDPQQVWAFGQLGMNQKPFRLFGGAPIITSHAATEQLAPKLEGALAHYKSRGDSTKYHDLAFTDFLIRNGIHASDIKGLYSNPPVYFVCCDWGHLDAKEGLPTYPLAFHYIQGPYLEHISFVLDDMRLCGDPPGTRESSEDTLSRHLADVAVGLLPSTVSFGSSEAQVLESWGQHFSGVLNDPDHDRPLRALTEKYPDHSWYVLTTLDTYIIPENLASLLQGFDSNEEPRMLMATPDDVWGTVVVNSALVKAWGHPAQLNGTTSELSALKAAFADYIRPRPELLSTAFPPKTGGGDDDVAAAGLCAAAIRFNRDWSMVADIQKRREETSQFYLIDYAVHFRRARRSHELYGTAPPQWYPTAHIPIHCERRRRQLR